MSIIKSIQAVSITIASGSTSNTATINAVTIANAATFLNGRTTNYTGNNQEFVNVAVTLTATNTVTATRGGSTTNAVTVAATIVEFQSAVVNSIQYGSVAISASTSGTTTLGTSVGSNSFVILNGETVAASATIGTEPVVSLNQGTGVVTATIGISGSPTVYFCVVDLTSTAIASVQQATFVGSTGTATTKTATINPVTTADTILVCGGLTTNSGGSIWNGSAFTAQLTNTTTVTFTRAATNSQNVNLLVTAVQFQSGVLTANAVQRGTTAISSSATSNTSGVTTVNTSFALCNYCGFAGGNASERSDEALTTVVLSNATTVTSTLQTASAACTTSWEVVEFASATTWTGTSTWPGVGTLVEGNESQIDVASATLGGVGKLAESGESQIDVALAALGGIGTFNAVAALPVSGASLPGLGTLIEGGESQIAAVSAVLGGVGGFTAVAVPGVAIVSGGAADEADPQTERRRRWLADHDHELPRVRVVRQDKPTVTPEPVELEAPQVPAKTEAPPIAHPLARVKPVITLLPDLVSIPLKPVRVSHAAAPISQLPPRAAPPPPTFSLRLAAIAAERVAQRRRDDEDDVAAVLGMM